MHAVCCFLYLLMAALKFCYRLLRNDLKQCLINIWQYYCQMSNVNKALLQIIDAMKLIPVLPRPKIE